MKGGPNTLLAGPWWPDTECWLDSFVIFQGWSGSIPVPLRTPTRLCVCVCGGGGGPCTLLVGPWRPDTECWLGNFFAFFRVGAGQYQYS